MSKRQAYDTMYYVLRRLISVMAPFVPHITEDLYQNLRCPGESRSVHMRAWFSGEPDLLVPSLSVGLETAHPLYEEEVPARQTFKRMRASPGRCVVGLSGY